MNNLMVFIKDMLLKYLSIYHKLLVFRLRHKKTIKVVFFAASISMWRYQSLYDLMAANPRFQVYIIIQPIITYSKEQQNLEVARLRDYFESKGIKYILGMQHDGTILNLRQLISPDILFYPQPYKGYYPSELSFDRFYHKLLCYIPYAFWTGKDGWSYDQPLHKFAWKLFYPTMLHKKDALVYSCKRGVNMEIVGYPTADDFMQKCHKDLWKSQSTPKKRIIWAPHFTIVPYSDTTQSNFLWMADFMIELSARYKNQIQFAFKPHPRLYTELCNHPEWGKDMTDKYYSMWESMENTQIELGEFVDLFMTSSAMIHDCGSFAVEYHYSGNPVLYVSEDFDKQVEEKNDFGKMAMRLHYVARNKHDILTFIDDVILKEKDSRKEERVNFMRDYLIPPYGKSAAENIMDILIKELC